METDRIVIQPLRPSDSSLISSAFTGLGWNKPVAQYDRYVAEQNSGERHVLVARVGADFAGYVTLCWMSEYAPFRAAGIPEIKDLNVLPRFRRCGVATELLVAMERVAGAQCHVVGLGVGLSPEYGAAQRLYVLRGYVPDGRGAASANRSVRHGDRVLVNDDLVLFLTKQLAARPNNAFQHACVKESGPGREDP